MVYSRNHHGKNNPMWKGGVSRLWYRKVMANAKVPTICILCEKVDKLDIHHKDGNNRNNKIENLEFRCKKCHSKAHPRKTSDETKKKLSINMKKQWDEGNRKCSIKFIENGKTTRFKKGHTPWWKKKGFKTAREAIISKRGIFKRMQGGK